MNHGVPHAALSPARRSAQNAVEIADVTAWWTTSVSDIEPGSISLRGYPVQDLIGDATFVETIWALVRGDLPSHAEAALLEKALVAAVDHGPQAPSIAAARMASTCGVGLHGAMSTGVGLLGDVHGGAGQQCVDLLLRLAGEVENRVRREGVDAAEARRSATATAIAEHRARRAYVPGFGHRFHPRDPRRDPLLNAVADAAREGTVEGSMLAVALELESQLSSGGRAIPMNIDGATAVIYAELGFASELARGLFILSRSVGILAHSWEESRSARRIKGPIPPPLLPDYAGPERRAMPRKDSK